jgi:hypothetical protein
MGRNGGPRSSGCSESSPVCVTTIKKKKDRAALQRVKMAGENKNFHFHLTKWSEASSSASGNLIHSFSYI